MFVFVVWVVLFNNDTGKDDTWMNILLIMKRLKFDAGLSHFFQVILVFIKIIVFWKATHDNTNQL